MLLTALYTLSDFGAVALMRYDAFTRVIYLQYTSSFDRSRAAILALVLVALTLGLLYVERRIAAQKRNYRAGTGAQRENKPVALGRWTAPALLFCAVLIGVGVITPLAVLGYWLTRGVTAGMAVTDLVAPALNTVGVSGLSALIVGLLALPPALLAVRQSSRLNRWMVQFAYLGNVLPGLVVALAFVFFAANALPSLYQTLPILILGYSTRFLPLSIGSTRSALTQINPRFEEAARSMGLRPWQVMTRITAPLARAGIFGGMALVFLSVMKELPTTLLLSPTGFATLPTEIWTAHNEVKLAQIGAPSLLLVAVSALSLILILRREQHQR
jgi:iron(III) transport system permease protein